MLVLGFAVLVAVMAMLSVPELRRWDRPDDDAAEARRQQRIDAAFDVIRQLPRRPPVEHQIS